MTSLADPVVEPLEPCPFCSAHLRIEPGGHNQFGARAAMRHPKNKCLLSGYGWGLLTHRDRWNSRTQGENQK